MLAIANVLDAMTRAEAARLAGLERQALRDAVLRFNAEGLDGLRDRPKSGRPPALGGGEQAVLRPTVNRRPRPHEGGGAWTLPCLCTWTEGRFGKGLHPASLSQIMRGLDLSRQKSFGFRYIDSAGPDSLCAETGIVLWRWRRAVPWRVSRIT